MRILHISYSISHSSAAYRISNACIDQDNYFLTARKTNVEYVKKRRLFGITSSLLGISKHLFNIGLCKILQNSKSDIFWFDFLEAATPFLINVIATIYRIDIVHVHWGGYGFLSVKGLSKIRRKLVITAHDYQYFTSGCHLPFYCDSYLDCNSCPLIKDNFLGKRYRARMAICRVEHNALLQSTKIVAPSLYTASVIVRKYPDAKVSVIPNPLPPSYHHRPPEGFDSHKVRKIMMVGVIAGNHDNKGCAVVDRLIERLVTTRLTDVEFIFVGCSEFDTHLYNNRSYKQLDDGELSCLYESADICVVPSRYETFSQVCLESLSRATPVVAFDRSGTKDILLSHPFAGFLVKSFDDNAFVSTVIENLNYKRDNYSHLLDVHETVKELYSPQRLGGMYSAIYREI